MRPHTTDGSFGSFVAGFNFADSRYVHDERCRGCIRVDIVCRRPAATPVYRYRGGGSAVISQSVLPAIHPRAPPVGNYNVRMRRSWGLCQE